MNHRRIEDCAPPEQVYLKPATRFSANFIGDVNVLKPGRLSNIAGLDVPDGSVVCLRPENVGLSGDLALGRAHMTDAAFFGTYHRCHFAVEGGADYIAHIPLGALPKPGAEVSLFARNPVVLKDHA